MTETRLLQLDLPKKRYQVLIGPGAGLFAVGDWRRYAFLQVLDVSKPAAPVHYPLFSDAELGERVLGQLPGSTVLNYARLVPASRGRDGSVESYEVSLYALERKGPQRVLRDGHALAYALRREGGSWAISAIDRTPATQARDEAQRSFVAAPPPALFVKLPMAPAAKGQP